MSAKADQSAPDDLPPMRNSRRDRSRPYPATPEAGRDKPAATGGSAERAGLFAGAIVTPH
ncbi:MAG TPA: hypothetical protein VKV20_09235 [Ktedonobacteraceae bacterium]|nr:hypothetical protein [Ktedonobacteraceae bacterium]